MKYLENKTDMILKYKEIFTLLQGQMAFLEKSILRALRQYDAQGDNEKQLIEGFFTMIEAVEKVVNTQMVLNGNKTTELGNFIKRMKEAFKALDMAAAGIDDENDLIAEAMEQTQHSTIH